MIAVNHIVPTVGYRIETAGGVIAFSGDTTTNDNFWEKLNAHDRLDHLIVEAAFVNELEELSIKSRHYCPSLLAADLKKLKHQPIVYLTHNKPAVESEILAQCKADIPDREILRLIGDMVIEI